MAAKREDKNSQDLNLILEVLGERGQKTQKWKKHYGDIKMIQQVLKLNYLVPEYRFMLRICGSQAEALNCKETNDAQDLDIMIIPDSDNLNIHNELIEYPPNNPLHVRIKGVDHPVLQSCLMKDTEYVATSALKNLHPNIYGSWTESLPVSGSFMLKFMSHFFSTALPYTCQFKNKTTSPAFTMEFCQSFASIAELVPNVDEAKLMEWFANRSKAILTGYTEENTDVFTPFQFTNELEVEPNHLGTDQLQEPCRNKSSIESRPPNESRRKINNSGKAFMYDNNPLSGERGSCHEDKSRKCLHPTSASPVTPKSGDDDRRSAQDSEAASRISSASNEPDNSDEFREKKSSKQVTEDEEEGDHFEDNKNENHNDKQNKSKPEGQLIAQRDEISSTDQPHNPDSHNVHNKDEFEEVWLEEMASRIGTCLFEHLFGTPFRGQTKADLSNETKLKDTEGKKVQENVVCGFDFVPAFRCQGWPKVAREWIKRERKWPSPEVVNKVIQEGFHLVVKPPKNGGNPDCDFRISFSHAEYLLVEQMNGIQRECYLCLKKYHRAYLSEEPKGLVSFHLKNLLLQTIEETDAEMWTESNRAECMMMLVGNLLQALKKKHLPHFFVRSYNLFCVDYIEGPAILESLAEKVDQIMGSPLQFAKGIIQNLEDSKDTKHVKKRESVPNSEVAASEKSATMGQNRDGDLEEDFSTQREPNLLSAIFSKINEHENSPILSYHDLKETYLVTCKQLIDTAYNDDAHCSLEDLDPLERALVEGLREIGQDGNGINIEDFDKRFNFVYMKVAMSEEPNMRRCLLIGIQSVVEMWKYAWKLNTDLQSENEEDVCSRIVETPFALLRIFLTGTGMELPRSWESSPAQPQDTDIDDIPLD